MVVFWGVNSVEEVLKITSAHRGNKPRSVVGAGEMVSISMVGMSEVLCLARVEELVWS